MRTRIAEIRESMGWNRAKLAQVAGVSYGALTKWENGTNEINLAQSQAVAHALGVKISDLLLDAPRRDEQFDEVARIYRTMSPEGRAALLATARGLAQAYPGRRLRLVDGGRRDV